jgi:hypothetical protein
MGRWGRKDDPQLPTQVLASGSIRSQTRDPKCEGSQHLSPFCRPTERQAPGRELSGRDEDGRFQIKTGTDMTWRDGTGRAVAIFQSGSRPARKERESAVYSGSGNTSSRGPGDDRQRLDGVLRLPRLESASQRHGVVAAPPELLRLTGARRFVPSAAVGDDEPLFHVSRIPFGHVVWWHAHAVRYPCSVSLVARGHADIQHYRRIRLAQHAV